MKAKQFSIQIFLERWYGAVFAGLFFLAVIGAIGIFYGLSYGDVHTGEPAVPPGGVLNESLVFTVNELLDVREEYFNRLRKLPLYGSFGSQK